MIDKEFSILVQNTDAFESIEGKNSFIQKSDTEWIGFADGDITSKEELCQILEENSFLLDYDVILFGDNVPEGECDQLSLLACPQSVIFAILFRKSLLVSSGSYNKLLAGNCNYEFLLRLAERGGVYAIPCGADKGAEFHPGTMAYILRRYMEMLKKNGCLDEMFMRFLEVAGQLGVKDEFNTSLKLLLDDTTKYESLVTNTAPILILIGNDICNGVVAAFGDLLADALSGLGQAVITTNGRFGDYHETSLDVILGRIYKAIIGFQSPVLESEAFQKVKGLKYQFWFDNPLFSLDYFSKMSKQTHVLCHDADYVRYIREHFLVERATQFPLAGEVCGLERGEEVYDLVFVGGYLPYTEHSYKDCFKQEFMEYMMEHPSYTVEQGIRALWQKHDIVYDEVRFLETVASLWDVCYVLMQNYRHRVVEAILSAGIQMHVFGESWKKYHGAGVENLIFHPEVCGEEALQIWNKAKIGLNIMNGHRHGMTERIANIMLCGSCCLSDETSYLREHFQDGEDIVLFRVEELEQLPGKIQYLLQRDEERRKIALAGQRRAQQEHTWRKRAEGLLEIIAADIGE
ncbi:MAG: glycosyltransferase family 1 protein [Lachnospiraceae bacterium]|nr:glycosyltransferase family 1 protein [Lachnospiraceae bacterium]